MLFLPNAIILTAPLPPLLFKLGFVEILLPAPPPPCAPPAIEPLKIGVNGPVSPPLPPPAATPGAPSVPLFPCPFNTPTPPAPPELVELL